MRLVLKCGGVRHVRACVIAPHANSVHDRTMAGNDARTERREETPDETSLTVLGRDGSQVVDLPAGASVVIGRQEPSDVVVDDPSLSRRHARFENADEGVVVVDLESTNGTFLHGARITRAVVKHGVEVRLGDVVVVVRDATVREPDGGLDEHDAFLARVDEELVRARTFGRSMALLVVDSTRGLRAGR